MASLEQRPNQPQTLTGIETPRPRAEAAEAVGPINLKPLQGLKRLVSFNQPIQQRGPINLKPLQGLKQARSFCESLER